MKNPLGDGVTKNRRKVILSNFKKYPKWVRLSKPFRIFAAEIDAECFGKKSSVVTTIT